MAPLTYFISQLCAKSPDVCIFNVCQRFCILLYFCFAFVLFLFCSRCEKQLVISNIGAVLGVFQKLVSSIKTEHYGITLICVISEYIPMATLSQFIIPIFNVLFARLRTRSSNKFKILMAVYLMHFVTKHGFELLANALNSIQPNLMEMTVTEIISPAIPTATGNLQKKTIVCGMVALLFNTREFWSEPWLSKWSTLLENTLGMYRNALVKGEVDKRKTEEARREGEEEKEEKEDKEEEKDLLDVTMQNFNTSFPKLAFAAIKEFDPNPTVDGNGFNYLINKLRSSRGQIRPLLAQISPMWQAII